jgi:N-acetylmuramoyl-L-alanine amidase
VVVLDPAHGGTDTGARGLNGGVEKDIVLQFARAARAELVRQGYRVVLTRDDDSNPSYDDRAAMANSYRDAIFINLHVSSTGTVGAARVYFYQFWTPLPPSGTAVSSNPEKSAPQPIALASTSAPTTLIPWDEAQRPYADASHRLADQLQAQLATVFTGSPGISMGVAERGLRSVTAPAVSIEISSVAAQNLASLSSMAAPLGVAVGKGLQSFRSANSAGPK